MSYSPEVCIRALQHLCRILVQTSKPYSEKTLCQAREYLAVNLGFPRGWSELERRLKMMNSDERKRFIKQVKLEILYRDAALVESDDSYFEIRSSSNGDLEISTLWRGYTVQGYEVRKPRGLEITSTSLISHRIKTGRRGFVINSPWTFRLWLELEDCSAMLHKKIAKRVFRYVFENVRLDLISEEFDLEIAKCQAELFHENFARCTYIPGSENEYMHSY